MLESHKVKFLDGCNSHINATEQDIVAVRDICHLNISFVDLEGHRYVLIFTNKNQAKKIEIVVIASLLAFSDGVVGKRKQRCVQL